MANSHTRIRKFFLQSFHCDLVGVYLIQDEYSSTKHKTQRENNVLVFVGIICTFLCLLQRFLCGVSRYEMSRDAVR